MASEEIIPLDTLFDQSANWRDGHGKATAISRSTSACISTIASSLLIYIIFRSKAGLKTSYHRILLGMSISDIFFSCGLISFNAAAPKDVDYMVWNAQGNVGSCEAFGFLVTMGFLGGLLYTSSLNLNYLAMVRYNKSESYIKARIEPFLLGVPAGIAVGCSVIALLGENLNPNEEGECATEPIYNPPHCLGLEDGEVREGFEIPCGRGNGWTAPFYYIVLFVVFAGVPVVICTSLGMMYKAVHRQESRSLTYGVNSLNIRTSSQRTDEDGTGAVNESGNTSRTKRSTRVSVSIGQRMSSLLSSRKFSSVSNEIVHSNSRAVMHRAMAYSLGYLLTWIWTIIYMVMDVVGALALAPPYPTWQIGFQYLTVIFSPLQGLFNFIIFMHPRVEVARLSRGGNLSWCRAFGKALGTSLGIHCDCRKKHEPDTTNSPTTVESNVNVARLKKRCSDNLDRKEEAESTVEVTTTHLADPSIGETAVERRLSRGEDALI